MGSVCRAPPRQTLSVSAGGGGPGRIAGLGGSRGLRGSSTRAAGLKGEAPGVERGRVRNGSLIPRYSGILDVTGCRQVF